MNQLKVQNLNKCLSILKDFVDEAAPGNSKKELAALALDQLRKITAGKNPSGTFEVVGSICAARPRIDG